MQLIKRLFDKRQAKREPLIQQIKLNDEGFLVCKQDNSTESVAWSEVERIITYKVDCYTYDMIWLAFERQGQDSWIQIPEETEGFKDLMSALNREFATIDPGWYLKVMEPAFAENITVLFERERDA